MSTNKFDYIVIGRGLMGSAAGRYLAKSNAKIAVIGPDEPDIKLTHDGVFASHYDEGRITRKLDPNSDWSLLSSRSISRYHEIEAESCTKFFSDVGSLIAGPEVGNSNQFINDTKLIQKKHGIYAKQFRDQALAKQFPYFNFPKNTLALYEPNSAGYISARGLVRAQTLASQKFGAIIFPQTVDSIEESMSSVNITTVEGNKFTAKKLLVAIGGFSNTAGILPTTLDLEVYARTVIFFELDKYEAQKLEEMPSLVFQPEDNSCDPYLLPPIRYPNKKTYLKIGGDPTNIMLSSTNQIKQWFRSNGDESAKAHLISLTEKLMPGLRYKNIHSEPCITTYTNSGKPFIGNIGDHITVLTGGNGSGAKCSDELGRIGAMMLLDANLDIGEYNSKFQISLKS